MAQPAHRTASRTRIKICGITRADDASLASRLGADAVGMVFYAASPRNVSTDAARAICAATLPFVSRVGLFVNPDPQFVSAVCEAVPLSLLQFHGDETAEFCASFGRPWVKALRVKPGMDLVKCAASYAGAAGLVLDAYTAEYGGAGVSFDWSLIPPDLPQPIILAGGLTADTVAAAIAKVRPYAVDVSSGVEAPAGPKGIKDAEALARFIAGVKNASV